MFAWVEYGSSVWWWVDTERHRKHGSGRNRPRCGAWSGSVEHGGWASAAQAPRWVRWARPQRPPRASRTCLAVQSTAKRRPGDLCSVHAATFSTLSRALRVVSRFSRSLSFLLLRGLPRTQKLEFDILSNTSRTLFPSFGICDRSGQVLSFDGDGRRYRQIDGARGRRTLGDRPRMRSWETSARPRGGRRHAVPAAAWVRVLRDAVRLLPTAAPAAGTTSATAPAAAASPVAPRLPVPDPRPPSR